MTPVLLVAVFCIGIFAGVLGAILGLGGGIIVVPALEFFLPRFGQSISIQQAVAVSQVGVLAVGLSGAASYLKHGLVQARTGYMLSPFTIMGGAVGSFLGLVLPAKAVATVFSCLLFYSAFNLIKGIRRSEEEGTPSPLVAPAMAFAGVMSGLLGIGGGTVQVPVLNLLGKMPIRQAIATSTFIMGLTAAANAMVYQAGGLLNCTLACALALGVLAGARAGAAIQGKIPAMQLKIFFCVLMLLTATQLLLKYWT